METKGKGDGGWTVSNHELDAVELQPLSINETSSSHQRADSQGGDTKNLLQSSEKNFEGSDSIHQLSRSQHKGNSWIQWAWTREYLIVTLSVACMAAIAIFLLRMHGRPLSSWKLPISPNALISVFATISKSAMLLALAESISQWKWLHFESVHKLKDLEIFDNASRGPWGAFNLISFVGARAWVASCAAVIVILSLAFDPFAQQVLYYHNQKHVLLNATASIGRADTFDSGLTKAPPVVNNPLAQNDAEYGINGAASDLINSAARGLFETSTDTAYHCATGNCTWPAFDSLGVCSSCQKTNASTACSAVRGCFFKSSNPNPYGANGTPGERLYAYADSHPSCASSRFAKIAVVLRDDAARNWLEEPAYVCDLFFCHKSYNRSSCNTGKLEDQPQVSERLVPYPAAHSPIHGNTSYLCAYRRTDDRNKVFWVNIDDMKLVGNALKQLFWTTLVTNMGANNYVASVLHTKNQGDIPKNIEAVATSMTNQIRQGPNATHVYGITATSEVYIHVSWAWLSLPILLVLLSVTFLTITVASTKEEKVVWKSSVLAILFHTMYGLQSSEAGLQSERAMQHAAEGMHAVLHYEDNGHVALLYSDQETGQKIMK